MVICISKSGTETNVNSYCNESALRYHYYGDKLSLLRKDSSLRRRRRRRRRQWTVRIFTSPIVLVRMQFFSPHNLSNYRAGLFFFT
mgnify:CR=1 FL=1